jgi:outer membrane scaffolding protein for murein synthesis (MipA/OmpV family)
MTAHGLAYPQPSRKDRAWLPLPPAEGATDVGLAANLNYHFSKHILLRSFVDVRQLVGSIADSPIVQSKTQVTIGTGVAYHF